MIVHIKPHGMLTRIIASSMFMFVSIKGASTCLPALTMGKTAFFCGSFIPRESNILRRISCSSDLRLRQTSTKFRHPANRNKLSMWLNAKKETITASDDIEIRTFYPRVDRIVAIGDVHGDVTALRSCLSIAGLLSSRGEWIGGDTHLVQVAATANSRLHMLPSYLLSKGSHAASSTLFLIPAPRAGTNVHTMCTRPPCAPA
jgi:hypothetical protein